MGKGRGARALALALAHALGIHGLDGSSVTWPSHTHKKNIKHEKSMYKRSSFAFPQSWLKGGRGSLKEKKLQLRSTKGLFGFCFALASPISGFVTEHS